LIWFKIGTGGGFLWKR